MGLSSLIHERAQERLWVRHSYSSKHHRCKNLAYPWTVSLVLTIRGISAGRERDKEDAAAPYAILLTRVCLS